MLSQNRLNHLLVLFKGVVMIALALLAACQSTQTPSMIRDEPQLPTQVALGDSEIAMLEKRLTERGVHVVSIGQDYLLSISAAALFADQSPRITWAAYDELNEVACYLRQFQKVAVDITGYTSRYVSSKRDQALSAARAEAVANYLWSQGIDSRLMFTRGFGSDKPMTTLTHAGGDKSPNARIEITFRRAVA